VAVLSVCVALVPIALFISSFIWDHGITGPLLFAFSVFISCLVRGVWAGCFLARMRREKHSFRDILNNLPSGKVPAEVVLSFEVVRSLVNVCTAFVTFGLVVHLQSSATTALCYVVHQLLATTLLAWTGLPKLFRRWPIGRQRDESTHPEGTSPSRECIFDPEESGQKRQHSDSISI